MSRARIPNVGEPLTVEKGFTGKIIFDGIVEEIRQNEKTGFWQARSGSKWTKAIFAGPLTHKEKRG